MEKEIGKVIHFYNKICVAIVKLTGELKVGDSIHIAGKQTDLKQKIGSLQIEHAEIQKAGKGQEVGLKTEQPVREGDTVYIAEAQ